VACGIGRALSFPGPILTRVLIGYEGREMRWLNAAKSTYFRKLPTDQKVRVAARVGVRSFDRHLESD
jgi:acetolactate synthase I/II/III large subunit